MNTKIISGEKMNKLLNKLLYIIMGLIFVLCADDLLADVDKFNILDSPTSKSFCEGLEGNVFNSQLSNLFKSDEKLCNTVFLQDLQATYYSSFSEAWEFNASISTGFWVPTGKNDILGAHPQLGFFMGGKRCRFEIGFSLLFRLLPAAHEYTVKYEGVLYDTTGYFGWYLGMDLGYEIFYRKGNGIFLLAGTGWDAFASEYISEDERRVWINSFNLNSGVGYRYYYKEMETMSSYIEVDFKYNFVDYKNPGGTDLSGNAVSVCFIWGSIFF